MHKLSVVIPAYNEENFIKQTLKCVKSSLSGIEGLDYEIIVANNVSTDNTAAIAESMEAKVVLEEVRNISQVRNTGASFANGDLLLFIDADSHISRELVVDALRIMESSSSPKNGLAVVAKVKLDKNNLITWISFFLFNIFVTLAHSSTAMFILVKKEAFEAVGGFPTEYLVFEDYRFLQNLRIKYGYNSVLVSKKYIISSSRKFKKPLDTVKYLLLALGAPFSKKAGTDKAKLDVWYGESAEDSRK